jgi:hypothetical protein
MRIDHVTRVHALYPSKDTAGTQNEMLSDLDPGRHSRILKYICNLFAGARNNLISYINRFPGNQ